MPIMNRLRYIRQCEPFKCTTKSQAQLSLTHHRYCMCISRTKAPLPISGNHAQSVNQAVYIVEGTYTHRHAKVPSFVCCCWQNKLATIRHRIVNNRTSNVQNMQKKRKKTQHRQWAKSHRNNRERKRAHRTSRQSKIDDKR